MDSRTTSSPVYRLDVIEPGRRRRWAVAEKLRIVEEITEVWGSVSATARRHGLSPAQLFAWRKAYREGRLVDPAAAARFAPAVIVPEAPPPDLIAATPGDRMEIVLDDGCRRPVRIVVGADVEAAALARVVVALEDR